MSKTIRKSAIKLDSINPQTQSLELVDLKKKKEEHRQLRKLRQTVQKELKFILKRDEILMKQSLRKKQELVQQINKQKNLLQYQNYKSRLNEQKQKQLLQKKEQTQSIKTKNKTKFNLAIQRNYQIKKQIANQTKRIISQWKLQKSLSEQKLLEQNKKHYEEIEREKVNTRESNRKFFQKKHSRIVQTTRYELMKSQRQSYRNKKIIQKIESDIFQIKHNSEKKHLLISKLQEDILNLRSENLSLSRSRSKILSPKNSCMTDQNSAQLKDGIQQEMKISSSAKSERKLSLPYIIAKKNLK